MDFVKCYFFLDGDQEEQDSKIKALCLTCHNEAFPSLGWFYEGACGYWEIKCGKCHSIIKQGKKVFGESIPDTD